MGKEIKTSTGLIVIFAAAVLFVGGALTYFYYNDPNSYINSVDATTVANTNANSTVDETSDWKTYSNDTYGFSFKYPKEWESTKKEETIEKSLGESSNDLLLKVSFYDPNMKAKIDCANNEFQKWSSATPTQTECQPILSALTSEEKTKYTGPRSPENVYARVYKNPAGKSLSDWLTSTFKKPNTELENYSIGEEIELGGEKGYFSSIGCCASVDRNYVIEANGYIISLGSNYFESSIKDTEMPVNFAKVAETFKIIDLTASWKTYTNDAYGFSFKYPREYTLTDNLPKTAEVNGPSTGLLLKKGKIEFNYWPKPAGWGYEDFNQIISTETVKIGGVSGTERVLSNSSLAVAAISTQSNNEYFFWIPINQQSDKTEVDLILSTFQFTK
jgi:hypothetical protein